MCESSNKVSKFINTLFPEPDNPQFDFEDAMRNAAVSVSDDEISSYLDLSVNIMGLSFNPKEAAPFSPMIVWNDGRKSFDVSDLTEADWAIIEQSVSWLTYLPLKARMADLLWLNKNQHKMALVAVECYTAIFNAHYFGAGYECFGYIQRAYVLSCQLGKNCELYIKSCSAIKNAITELDIKQSEPHYILHLMELLQENRYGDADWGKKICEQIILRALFDNDIGLVEIGTKIKINWLKYPPQDLEQIKQERIRLAKTYENAASFTVEKSLFNAIDLYEQALLLYRQQRCQDDEVRVRRLLDPLKRKLPDSLHQSSHSIDVTELHEYLVKTFDGKSIPEQLVLLGLNVGIQSKQALKDVVLNKCKASPISAAFPVKRIDSEGKTLIEIPPVNIMDPEQDLSVLELNMWNEGLLYQIITGQSIRDMLHIITDTHEIQESDLDFLFENNAFVPLGREDKFKKGIWQGVQGDFTSAIHLLIPQFENALREFAELCGALVTTFEDNRTEQAKVLSSILDAPEFVEAYDENIIFCLKGLLNEKAGANLRNMLAHGLLENGNDPVCMYFWGIVLRFLVWYSPKAWGIIMSLRGNKNIFPEPATS